jgi:hypothetical protein
MTRETGRGGDGSECQNCQEPCASRRGLVCINVSKEFGSFVIIQYCIHRQLTTRHCRCEPARRKLNGDLGHGRTCI